MKIRKGSKIRTWSFYASNDAAEFLAELSFYREEVKPSSRAAALSATKSILHRKTKMLKLNLNEKIAIAECIKEHAAVVDGLCIYEPGWNDERVLQTVGGRADIYSIRSVRKQTVGPVKKQPIPKPLAADLLQYDDLVRRVQALEDTLKRVTAHPMFR